MLESKEGFNEYCNYKTALRPMIRNKNSLFAAFFIYLACNAIVFVFIFPCVKSPVWFGFFIGFLVITMFFFLRSWLISSKVKAKPSNLVELLEKHDCSLICPECRIVKPKRSKHCEYCKECIMIYDHHCPWVDNCVGANNHGSFIAFLYSIWLNIAFIFILSAAHIKHSYDDADKFIHLMKNSDEYKALKFSTMAIILGTGLFFIIPLSLLVYVQTKNFIFNKTTLERFGFTPAKNIDQSSIDQSADFTISDDSKLSTSKQLNQTEQLLQNQEKEKISYCKNCWEMCRGTNPMEIE